MNRNQQPFYTFKVAFKYDREVWRRIEVRANQTLEDLHWAIFDAYDRDDEHLYSFYFEPTPGYRPRRPTCNAIEDTHPSWAKEGAILGRMGHRPVFDACDTTLESLQMGSGRKFD